MSVGTINAKLLTFGYYAFGIRNTTKGFQGRIGHFCTCLFFFSGLKVIITVMHG